MGCPCVARSHCTETQSEEAERAAMDTTIPRMIAAAKQYVHVADHFKTFLANARHRSNSRKPMKGTEIQQMSPRRRLLELVTANSVSISKVELVMTVEVHGDLSDHRAA
mmetsp:Transcript_72583/g.137918  ORF Transcript_72583/g.137918 Transcript_72583/m.137918 type:complete len:109 (+) Transcript_72583:288-614(+)